MNIEALKEQWEGLPEWQKILVTALITLLIMYGIYALMIDPKKIEKEQLKSEVDNLKVQVDRLKRFARPEIRKKLEDKLAAVQSEVQNLSKELEKIKSVVPTEEKTQEILRFISDSALKSSVVMNKFRVSPPEEIYMRYNKTKDRLEIITGEQKKKDKSFIKIKRIKITLDLNSRTVGNVVDFLRKLGKSDRFFRLDKLTIEKVKKKKGRLFNIKLTVSTYYM